MCSSQTKIKCPICNEYIDQNRNRIIVELCGHSKCRQCFITEENGCVLCHRDNEQFEKSTKKSSIEQRDEGKDCPIKELNAVSVAVPNIDSPSVQHKNGSITRNKIEILENVLVVSPSPPLLPVSPSEPINPAQHNGVKVIPDGFFIGEPKTDYSARTTVMATTATAATTITPSHIEVIKVNNEISFKCRICQKQFRSRNNKKYHFYCDQKLSKPLQCDKCDKSFITSFHLQYHLKTHQSTELYGCTQCERKYMREISLKKHMRKHKNELKFKCNECDQKFIFREQLKAHEDKHKNNRHTCKQCNKSFWLKSNLTKHSLIHSGIRPFKCNDCDKSFNRNSALKSHRLIHLKCRPFICRLCSKAFIDQRSLDRHSRIHTREITLFECTHCTVKCSRRDNIRRHVRNIHSHENVGEILRNIFQNYTNKSKKTDKIDVNYSKPKDANNATSVIRFIGKSTMPLIVHEIQKQQVNEQIIHESDQKAITMENTQNSSFTNETQPVILVNKIDNIPLNTIDIELDKNVGKSDVIYQPLSLDPPPPIDHLIVQRSQQHCSNIKVYRQLLSPYLKPSAKWRAKSNFDNQELQRKQNQNGAQHLVEPIEQNFANHSDKTHSIPNNRIDKIIPDIFAHGMTSNSDELKPIEDEKNVSNLRSEKNNYENRNKTVDQYAIYRKILRRSNE